MKEADILIYALAGSEQEAKDEIRELSQRERERLRMAMFCVDDWMDDVDTEEAVQARFDAKEANA